MKDTLEFKLLEVVYLWGMLRSGCGHAELEGEAG